LDSGQGRLLAMSRINNQIWTASQKSVKIWDVENATCIKEIEGLACAMAQVGKTVWVGGDGKITIYDLESVSIFIIFVLLAYFDFSWELYEKLLYLVM
jgi:hypothetical protein